MFLPEVCAVQHFCECNNSENMSAPSLFDLKHDVEYEYRKMDSSTI